MGGGAYTSPEILPRFPAVNAPVSFGSVDGSGALDIIVNQSDNIGFYQNGLSDLSWQSYQALPSFPSDFDINYAEAVSLNANGKTDYIRVYQDHILMYPSHGKDGYGAAVLCQKPEDFPALNPGDFSELVTFSDFFGDGLSHRIRLRNGQIDVWPDLGFGKFGDKITLNNAPIFQDEFDARRIRLVDIDGSGFTDIAYIYPTHVDVYFNQSGNGFSDPVSITLPEMFTPEDRLEFSDLNGNGTMCLLLTKRTPAARCYFVDLAGAKPYLLTSIDNNLGATTQIEYASSTQFYLQDKKAGRIWPSRIYFPIQLVASVTSEDSVSGSKFVNRFAYHDGHYDTVEEVFCGFGCVESWDTETYTAYQTQNPKQPVPEDHYAPPVLTRTWYYTGCDSKTSMPYYDGDANDYPMPDHLFPETLPDQARFALRGSVLRSEVYAQDDSAEENVPYQVAQSAYQVKLYQQARFGIFLVLPYQSISYDYDRNPQDPRVTQNFVLKTNDYGQVERSCGVVLARRTSAGVAAQDETKITVTDDDYINLIYSAGRYIGVLYQKQAFEICNNGLSNGVYVDMATLQKIVPAAMKNIQSYNGNTQELAARRLSWQRNYFCENGEALELGQVAAPLLHYNTQTAICQKEDLAAVYNSLIEKDQMTLGGGYVYDSVTGYYWNPGLVAEYFSAEEYFLEKATRSFADEVQSVFYTRTSVTYDSYLIHPISVTSYLAENNHVENIKINYNFCVAEQVVDINQNVLQVLFDPLGEVVVSSYFGEAAGPDDGGAVDTGSQVLFPYKQQTVEYNPVDVSGFEAAEVLGKSADLLQGASQYFFYDFTTVPATTISLVNNDDVNVLPGYRPQAGFQTSISYLDGFGRVIQKKDLIDSRRRRLGHVADVAAKCPTEQFDNSRLSQRHIGIRVRPYARVTWNNR